MTGGSALGNGISLSTACGARGSRKASASLDDERYPFVPFKFLAFCELQLSPDGSWGAELPCYEDRLLSTLAAVPHVE